MQSERPTQLPVVTGSPAYAGNDTFWVVESSRLRQLGVDVSRVDDDVLDEHARLDLVALEIGGEHLDAELAPLDRIELDRHRQALLLHGAQRRRNAVHASDQRLALAAGGVHRLHGAER